MMIMFYIQLCVLQRNFVFIQDNLKKNMYHLCSVRNAFNHSLIPILKGTTQQVTLILIFSYILSGH